MTFIPQPPETGSFPTYVVILALFCASCLFSRDDSSALQRRIGEAELPNGISFSANFGVIRDFDTSSITIRASAPTVELAMRSGAIERTGVDVDVRNVHVDGTLQVASVTFLSATDELGCPPGETTTVSCVAATADVGSTCTRTQDCEEGLQCAVSATGEKVCQRTDRFTECTTTPGERDPTTPTTLTVELTVVACRAIQYEIAPPTSGEVDETVVVVIGETSDSDTIRRISDVESASADFIVILGDNAERADIEAIDSLDLLLDSLALPTVAIAGETEAVVSQGDVFLRRLGPHEHIWELGNAKFASFYSATGSLGVDGLDRFNRFLTQVRVRGDEDAPILAFAHVAPIDPEGLRDTGFRSPLEAGQVLSSLKSNDVSHLFTTNAQTTTLQKIGGLEVHHTHALSEADGEYLRVTISGSPAVVTVTSMTIP